MQSSDTVGAFSLDTKRVSMSSAVETPFRFSAQQYDTDEISKPRLVTSERGLKPTPPFVFLRITRRLLYGHVLTSWEKGKLRIENPGKEAEDAIPDFDVIPTFPHFDRTCRPSLYDFRFSSFRQLPNQSMSSSIRNLLILGATGKQGKSSFTHVPSFVLFSRLHSSW